MFKEVIRALRLPVYTIAAVLILAAYVFAYFDYVHSVALSSQVNVSGQTR